MTTKELIKDLLEEYTRRKERGEVYYTIDDFYIFFLIDKHFSLEEKESFCLQALDESFSQLKAKRQSIIDNSQRISYDDLEEISQEVYPYKVIFQYASSTAAQLIEEDKILAVLSYYDPPQLIEVYSEFRHANKSLDLSDHILPQRDVLDVLMAFLTYHSLSDKLKRRLEEMKTLPTFQKREWQSAVIDEIIQGEVDPNFSKRGEQKVRELSAQEIVTDKKWKTLADKPLDFISQKETFYSLIEELSKVDYFNRHEISPQIKETIASISHKEYEAFILDMYDETKREGKKRSSWFIGDKVVAFRIFVWLMHQIGTPNQYSILSKLAEKCFTKIPRVGPISRKLGDLVLRILYESETIEGLGILLSLKSRAKYPVFREALGVSIRRAINYTKLDPNEVEDYFIDDYGLVDGEVIYEFGDFSSKLEIDGQSSVQLRWFKKDGTTQKSVPTKVKSAYPAELKLWKAKHKDIKKALSGQKQRIEGFWRKNKQWEYANWEKYILKHELIRFISRSLIWQFETPKGTKLAIWKNGCLVNTSASNVEDISDSTVSLWHPCHSDLTTVESWRAYLLEREIKQAFKQAFREIYLLTDAEITSSSFSNRFLNHVVRHHKFAALAKQRTWTYANVYAQHDPFIEYPEYKIKASLDLESDYDYARTGRVHFRDTSSNKAMLMEEVPEIIFSETMRDVDLFVGVCSIGIEEEWHHNQYMNYWRNYSTADLSETAKTRRSVLVNMLPKLKISNQCELMEKYLKVKGKVRTYKIHLGSGNILMEPNDQYLCIVPDRSRKGSADGVFLPFDDDLIFSIILSKAFLLAEDDKIKDKVILNQIHK
ncbi:MAG: DUF4132 domain-containing protein [Bacteroidota bacterium]